MKVFWLLLVLGIALYAFGRGNVAVMVVFGGLAVLLFLSGLLSSAKETGKAAGAGLYKTTRSEFKEASKAGTQWPAGVADEMMGTAGATSAQFVWTDPHQAFPDGSLRLRVPRPFLALSRAADNFWQLFGKVFKK